MSNQPVPSAYQPPGYCPHCDYPTDWGTCPECGFFFNNRQLRAAPHGWIHRHRVVVLVMVALLLGSLWFVGSSPTLVPHFPTLYLLALQSSTLALADPATKELGVRFVAGELAADQKVRFLKKCLKLKPEVHFRMPLDALSMDAGGDQAVYSCGVKSRLLVLKGKVQSQTLFVSFKLTDIWVCGKKTHTVGGLLHLPKAFEADETVELGGTVSVRDFSTANVVASWKLRDRVIERLPVFVPVYSPSPQYPPGLEDLLFPYGRNPRKQFPPDRIGEPGRDRG